MSQFVDQVKIKVLSGDGGNGMVAWRREKYEPLGGPAGGRGGRGGHVILEATTDLSTLLDFRFKVEFKAEPGQKGGPKNRAGKDGKDLIIKVPVGTLVKDLQSDQYVADLSVPGKPVLIAEGGRGGRGNVDLVTMTRRAPHYCEPGESGIERELELTLKLISDVGLIGLPNAGKSTMLSVLTNAKPKIADYPFSTLSPNLGVMRKPNGDGVVLADIPGLVSGASTGHGLGHTFLRHIERTRILVHVVDLSSQTVEEDIKTILTELRLFDPLLAKAPQILFFNKADLFLEEEAQEKIDKLRAKLEQIVEKETNIERILAGSCATRSSIDQLKIAILDTLNKTPEKLAVVSVVEDLAATQRNDQNFTVHRSRGIFYVSGLRVEKMLAVTNTRDSESLEHFFQVLRAMGVVDALLKEGCQEGSEVVVGKTSFTYGADVF